MSNMPPPLPSQPPMYMGPPPPKKGLSGCAIAAIIVGVLCALVVIGIGVGGYVFMQKAGGKAGMVKSVFAMANPDYDILEVNENAKTITVRHKKTGKTATIDIASLKNGKIDPEDVGLTAEQAEGTGDAPSWVKYPNGRLLNSAKVFSMTTLMYRTSDPVDKVIEYYQTQITAQGIHATAQGNGGFIIKDAKGELNISVTRSGNEGARPTTIAIVYRVK